MKEIFTEKYKDALARYEDFWEGKNTGRPILNISYSNDTVNRYRKPVSLEEKYLDAQYRYDSYKYTMNNNGYLAEGIPMFFANLGPGCLAAAIGGDFALANKTVWFGEKPIVLDWDNPPEVSFDEQSELWSKLIEIQSAFANDPETHFSMTDIGGIMDVVASLRGTENLLYDLYDYPDEVKMFTSKVKAEWFKSFDQQIKAVREAGQPFNSWMNIPSSKPWYPIQCDFCYMISPAQFEEFVLDDIVDQVNYMDRSIYHLDGPGEIPHLDMLLDIDKLTGIQWVSGSGEVASTNEKWFELFRKIQDKNKNIVLLDVEEYDLEALERLLKTFDPSRFYISMHCSSKGKAEEILESVTRWSE